MRRATVTVLLLVFCMGVAHADDERDIVGRWDNPVFDAAYFRFNADGTFKSVALLTSQEGNYRLLPGVIELDAPGVLYGRNKVEVKYRLTGDTLELRLFGDWVKYTRTK